MSENEFKQYIYNQLEDIRNALLDDEDHTKEIAYNLGVLMATIDLNTSEAV